MFNLHPRLNSDTFLIEKLDICGLYLINDSRYKWVILVPEIEGLVELHDLGKADYNCVMQEVRRISALLCGLYNPKKINVGALGNMVEQLHIHIIARTKNDAAWPGPVWGAGKAIPYTQNDRLSIISDIKKTLPNQI